MGRRQRISATPRDDRPRCSCSPRPRLSFDSERRSNLRHAMVHFHQWPHRTDKIFSVIKNFGKRSSSMPTKNMSLSDHWTHLSEIPRLIFNASSNTPQSMPTTTRWCRHASSSRRSAPGPDNHSQYDGDELGALAYYRDHLANRLTEARAETFSQSSAHGTTQGTRTPTDEVAGIKFGPGAVVDLNDLHRQWYDWTMKSGPRPEFLKNQVAYYLARSRATVAQMAKWKYADRFRNLRRKPAKLFTSIPKRRCEWCLSFRLPHRETAQRGCQTAFHL